MLLLIRLGTYTLSFPFACCIGQQVPIQFPLNQAIKLQGSMGNSSPPNTQNFSLTRVAFHVGPEYAGVVTCDPEGSTDSVATGRDRPDPKTMDSQVQEIRPRVDAYLQPASRLPSSIVRSTRSDLPGEDRMIGSC